MKKDLNRTEEALLGILQALFPKAPSESELCPKVNVIFGDSFEEKTEDVHKIDRTKKEERDLLGELTASFIIDGLDVTRKDTLLMVLFDNRLRASLGEKITHRINLVCR